MNMKKVSDYLVYAMSILAIVFSASSFVKVYANKTPVTSVTSSSAAPGQPVDLTFAAEKAVPSVVTIRVVQNSKTQTVEVEDPFGDFFSDPFGWLATRVKTTNRNVRYRPRSAKVVAQV